MLDSPMNQSLIPSDAEMGMFDEVDKIIGQSVAAGDPLIALEYGKSLIGSAMMRGLALAKLFYKLRENWSLFQAAGVGDNLKTMALIHTGRSAETVEKYIRMWESVFENEDIPDDIKRKLMGRPIGDLLLITALAREGTDKKTFEQLANAADSEEVRDIIKGERGERTSSKNAVYVTIEMRDEAQNPKGTIIVRRGGQYKEIGSLDVDSDNELVQKGVSVVIAGRPMKEIQ